MHLLRAAPGQIDDGGEAVDLGQDPADVVFMGHADTELALLARSHARLGESAPSLRLANLARLRHHLSVDTYVERTIEGSRLVVVRLLGGKASWDYGVERVSETCSRAGIPLLLLPGDQTPDIELARLSTLPEVDRARLWAYLVEGGAANARNFLRACRALLDGGEPPPAAEPLARAGIYRSSEVEGPEVVLVFYRALVMAEDLAPVDALMDALERCGLRPEAVFVSSLKDPVSAAFIDDLFAERPPEVVLNLTGFAVSAPGAIHEPTPLDRPGAPVLQAVLSGSTEKIWRESPQGLTARDLAMSVVLPEIDGRVLTRAVGFKSAAERSAATQSDIIALRPAPDRVAFVARQAAAWARLRLTARGQRRIALLLANYPNKDARLANGVGLDTPASLAVVVEALADAGYSVGAAPRDGRALMDLLRAGPTNTQRRASGIRLDLDAYRRCFEELPVELRAAMVERWGPPEEDPTFLDGAFHLALHRFGNMVVGIQPARGYNIDPKATYHDPALVPPHGYLAFYAWLRQSFDAQALIHLGKHGNLEWLPGKALALDAGSWPEVVMGELPHLYPFIVNDPGEGSQAKRRTSAVIIDHLTPPLTRAETHGRSRDLEALVDEYYDASGQDPRRLELLAKEILELISLDGLGEDAGIDETDAPEDALVKLDAYLCELKELQIRDGLHVFGKSPEGRLETDLLAALARLPRPGAASLTTALADGSGTRDRSARCRDGATLVRPPASCAR